MALKGWSKVDTDDLTPMAYETINHAGHVLRSEIGASATGKITEDDFLRAILRSARGYLDGWK